MFIQMIQGACRDSDALRQQIESGYQRGYAMP